MKLTQKQIDHIITNVKVNLNHMIVMLDVYDEEDKWSVNESNFNIYCIDQYYNILWQVVELKTKPRMLFGSTDPFYYLGQKSNGEIIASRFSGFEYKIDPETGEATQTGFHK